MVLSVHKKRSQLIPHGIASLVDHSRIRASTSQIPEQAVNSSGINKNTNY